MFTDLKRQVAIYLRAIAKICEPFGIEVVETEMDGNIVVVIKFNK